MSQLNEAMARGMLGSRSPQALGRKAGRRGGKQKERARRRRCFENRQWIIRT